MKFVNVVIDSTPDIIAAYQGDRRIQSEDLLAYELGSRDPPALILMDVWMPGRSGIQGCTLFRETPATAHVPIILMSGSWSDENQLSRAMDSGATDVLAKDQQETELAARVRSALRSAKLQRELLEAERRVLGIRAFLAICAGCKHVRGGDGEWEAVETYLSREEHRELTHGICPDCRDKLYASDDG